ELHRRHIDAEIRLDAIAHLDSDQGIETKIIQRLLGIQTGRWNRQRAGELLEKVALNELRGFLPVQIAPLPEARNDRGVPPACGVSGEAGEPCRRMLTEYSN